MTLDIHSGPYDQNQEVPQFPGFYPNANQPAEPRPDVAAKPPVYEEALFQPKHAKKPDDSADPGESPQDAHDRGDEHSTRSESRYDDPKPAKKPADAAKRYVGQMAQFRRLARKRRDDPNFPWEKWGDAFGSANRLAGNKWATTFKFALCAGKGVFDDIGDVPQHILNAVQDGLNRAWKRQTPIKYTPEDLSRKFRVTCAQRYRLKLWAIGAIDATPEQCREYAERQRQRKARDADTIAGMARAMGVDPQTKKPLVSPHALQQKFRRWKKAAGKPLSAERRKEWEGEGISRRTWYRHRAKAKGAATVQAGTENEPLGQGACPKTHKGSKTVAPKRENRAKSSDSRSCQVARPHVFEGGVVPLFVESLASASTSRNAARKAPRVPNGASSVKAAVAASAAANRLGAPALRRRAALSHATMHVRAFAAVYSAWSPASITAGFG